jgi:Fe(3+) dicitrate transport protein
MRQVNFKTDWGTDVAVNYVSQMRAQAGDGTIPANELIDARTIVDATAYITLAEGVRIKAKVENLFDETYIAARRPAGLRPGKPRQAFVGLQLDF